ncbi:MAG: hypothetical protein COV75_02135 [Candidatus Omnitrophica bacterium CG11_big_fil_rev_8_21_14_0_20_63_9]|nr:MAG: hypothetical protein COV75_02135 [Candidatus Omnitrophica bacterium CG11_big_fil_rev_8_21_14_0_20_63_9]
MKPHRAFIEHVTLRGWLGSILPKLIWLRLRNETLVGRCGVFEGSAMAFQVARITGGWFGFSLERLRFRLMDVRDEHGRWIRTRLVYQDLAEVQADIIDHDAVFAAVGRRPQVHSRIPTYLAKCVASVGLSGRGTVWRSLMTIRVCEWMARTQDAPSTPPLLFLERHRWFEALERYASRCGVRLMTVPTIFDLKAWLRRRLNPEVRRAVRHALNRWQGRRTRAAVSRPAVRPTRPRVMAEYYGQLNLKHPECFSDLFFWQQSPLSGDDLLVTFNIPRSPLDAAKWAELTEHGVEALALQPSATTLSEAPMVMPGPRPRATAGGSMSWPESQSRTREARWLREHAQEYARVRQYWTELFATYGIKVYLTWFKYNEAHCAIADALQSLGGICAVYQRSYEEFPSSETTIDAEVVFGFSQATAEVERRSGSIIPYHVTVGYPGDHRFSMLRDRAREVRQLLHRHGAERILAFADENSLEDARWFFDHQSQQECYQFLLERLLEEPWLGLVLKPKVPLTLRRRLGPVAALLDRAMATGRCFVYDQGALHAAYPPAAAALAADLMVHGQLSSATAGLEAALAGVPTLLLDREQWSISPLYQLGVGRVVFNDWSTLWQACREHWKRPGGVPGFGDWSPLLDELDPFRDGRAAERIGTYIHWLLEGFKAGVDRETILADAAQRYAALWGTDKVSAINVRPRVVATSENDLAAAAVDARRGVSA